MIIIKNLNKENSKEINSLIKRDSSLDIIRIVAFMSVVAVHFYLNSGFYNAEVIGWKMYLMIFIRTLLMDCVPLFIILSGYLLNKKKLSKEYYLGIIKTLLIYLLSCICCLIFFRINNTFTLRNAIGRILNFTAAPYAWYIEMYIGLFMLIPFLNNAYNGLKSKRQKQVLIITMLFLTTIPLITNMYYKLIPGWWTSIYPITYYFIGCYINEFGISVKTRYLIILLLANLILTSNYIYSLSYGTKFVGGIWDDYGSIINVITAFVVFVILKRIDTSKWNIKLKKVIKYISSLCLAGYLLSWIFDILYYPILGKLVPIFENRVYYIPIIVIAVTLSTLILSTLITLIATLLEKYISNFIKKHILNKIK